MMDSELEELKLQVEGGVCKLPIMEMEQLAEHVGLESKEYKGKGKLAMSRIVREKVEVELGQTESKVGISNGTSEFYCWKATTTRRNREKRRRTGKTENGIRSAMDQKKVTCHSLM